MVPMYRPQQIYKPEIMKEQNNPNIWRDVLDGGYLETSSFLRRSILECLFRRSKGKGEQLGEEFVRARAREADELKSVIMASTQNNTTITEFILRHLNTISFVLRKHEATFLDTETMAVHPSVLQLVNPTIPFRVPQSEDERTEFWNQIDALRQLFDPVKFDESDAKTLQDPTPIESIVLNTLRFIEYAEIHSPNVLGNYDKAFLVLYRALQDVNSDFSWRLRVMKGYEFVEYRVGTAFASLREAHLVQMMQLLYRNHAIIRLFASVILVGNFVNTAAKNAWGYTTRTTVSDLIQYRSTLYPTVNLLGTVLTILHKDPENAAPFLSDLRMLMMSLRSFAAITTKSMNIKENIIQIDADIRTSLPIYQRLLHIEKNEDNERYFDILREHLQAFNKYFLIRKEFSIEKKLKPEDIDAILEVLVLFVNLSNEWHDLESQLPSLQHVKCFSL